MDRHGLGEDRAACSLVSSVDVGQGVDSGAARGYGNAPVRFDDLQVRSGNDRVGVNGHVIVVDRICAVFPRVGDKSGIDQIVYAGWQGAVYSDD